MTCVYRDDFGREITYEEWLDLKYAPENDWVVDYIGDEENEPDEEGD